MLDLAFINCVIFYMKTKKVPTRHSVGTMD